MLTKEAQKNRVKIYFSFRLKNARNLSESAQRSVW